MIDVVLDIRHDALDGYSVIVVDDRDGYELYRTPQSYPSIPEACHAACEELQPYEHVTGVLEPLEVP